MNITISNDLFSAEIASFGAELQSLKNRKTGMEYIWQRDPDIWGSSAPVLFPVVGRMKNSSYRFEEKTYSMPLHGFARTSAAVSNQPLNTNSQNDTLHRLIPPAREWIYRFFLDTNIKGLTLLTFDSAFI